LAIASAIVKTMGKILLLAIAIWLVITILKQYRQSIEKKDTETKPLPEDMVQCISCGVHLPKSDSLLINNEYYCCESHSKNEADSKNS